MMVWHRDGLIRATEQALRQDGVGAHLVDVLTRMRRGDYKDLEQLAQGGSRKTSVFDIYDAYAFAQVRCLLFTGRVFKCVIEVGVCPSSDQAIKENNDALSTLPTPFVAKFLPARGGGANNDGTFRWTDTITCWSASSADNPMLDVAHELEPRSVPLEVGSTELSLTLAHIVRHGGVARWPYNSTWIHMYVTPTMFSLASEYWAEAVKSLKSKK